jgi:hypothetical protein
MLIDRMAAGGFNIRKNLTRFRPTVNVGDAADEI